MSSRVPVGAEARGRLRQWKRAALDRFSRIEATLASRKFDKAARDFNHKSAVGRRRALPKLRAMLSEACFEEAHADYVLWAYFHPRESVVCPNEGVGPALLQDCVTVDFIALGRRTWNYAVERIGSERGQGLWSIEATDHALGRALQRDPAADLDALILEAHHAALAMRPAGPIFGFLLPAGNGAFRCSLRAGPDTSTGQDCVWVVAHTWLHNDQLAEDQHLAPAGDPTERLGNHMLRPLALRHLDGLRP
jgi:hypothetical protein